MSKTPSSATPSPAPPAASATPPSLNQREAESSDPSISKKLDLLTSMMLTLAEKTNEALSEVAKLNHRISAPPTAPNDSSTMEGSAFYLDVPKQPKGWKEGANGRPKTDKKGRGVKSGHVASDKSAPAVRYDVRREKTAKKGEILGDTLTELEGEQDSNSSPRDSKIDDQGSSPPLVESPALKKVIGDESANSRAVSRSFSSRATLQSRTSMSSIDLNDLAEMEASNSVIMLNVGGRRFWTTRATLTSVPGTMFEALLSGRHAVLRDSEGGIFLDRDPDMFEHVLTYLRDPRQLDLRYFSQQQQMRILCEMDYFMVPFTRFSRDLPLNLTGHTLVIERDSQWTMKWTNRGWWVSTDHSGESGSSNGQNGPGTSNSMSASGGHASSSLAMPTTSSAALKAANFSASSGGGTASPPIEPPPGLKFVDNLVWVNIKGRPLRAYDIWTGQCLKIVKELYCDCFAASSEQLVTYDADDQSLRLWNARTSTGVSWIKADVPPTNISCLAFVNESVLVLGGDGNKCVTLNLPAASDLQATATTVLQGANLRQIEPLSPSVIAVGSTNGNIILWNIKLNVLLGTIPTAQQRISTIFARNNYIFCLSPETIKVWDCFTNPSKPSCVAMIFDEVTCLDSDGDLIVGITADRSRKSLLKVWSLSSSKLVHVMAIPAGETVFTVHVKENRVATVLEGGTVLTWTINLFH